MIRPRFLVVEQYRAQLVPIERARWTRRGAERAAARAAERARALHLPVHLQYRVVERT